MLRRRVFEFISALVIARGHAAISLLGSAGLTPPLRGKPVPTFTPILHQVWIGDDRARPQQLMHGCKTTNEDMTYMLHVNPDIDWFRSAHSKRLYNLYGQKKDRAAQSDIFRYEVLYRYGGVYADADTLCIRPFSWLLTETSIRNADIIVAYHHFQNPDVDAERQKDTKVNGAIILARSPRSSILARAIDGFKGIQKIEAGWITVGPLYLTDILAVPHTAPETVAILPYHYFYPYHFTEHIPSDIREMTKAKEHNSTSVNLWGTTLNNWGGLAQIGRAEKDRMVNDTLLDAFRDPVSADEDEMYIRLMKEVDAAGKRCNVTTLLAGGSLVGSLTMHRRLPWDDDVDMYVVGNTGDQCVRDDIYVRSAVTGMTAMVRGQYFKVFFKQSPAAGKYPWRYPFVDVFTLHGNATHMWQKTTETPMGRDVYARDWILPTTKRAFGGHIFDAPARSVMYARHKYAGQFFSCTRGGWDHRREVLRKIFTVDCKQLKELYPFVEIEKTGSPKLTLEHLKHASELLHTSVLSNRSTIAVV